MTKIVQWIKKYMVYDTENEEYEFHQHKTPVLINDIDYN